MHPQLHPHRYEPNPEFWNVDPDFAFGLFDLDYDTFGKNLEGALIRCPAVETAGEGFYFLVLR
jgi:sarcosine dehydrogenase